MFLLRYYHEHMFLNRGSLIKFITILIYKKHLFLKGVIWMWDNDSLIKEYSKYAHHLGNYYPYFIQSETPGELFLNIREALNELDKIELDFVGIVEIVYKSYFLGNRTLIQNIKRLPWMTSYDSIIKHYNLCYQLPAHDKKIINIEVIANMLKKALKKELENYIAEKRTVGILLSGGLDSRILAGLLKELQIEGKYTGDVISITWGLEQSRDVIYAKEISKRYLWTLEHIELNSKILHENVYLAGKMGAEFSPYHLHGMNKVKEIDKIEAVIAGSYGDGVGRAEFSGKKIMDLKPTIKKNINPYGILRQDLVKLSLEKLYSDTYTYKKYINRSEEYQYLEIEQELHYMRRKLNACMNIIGEKIPVYQLYTDPDAFGLMWSTNPKQRNDEIYKLIIASLPCNMNTIPWARDAKTIYSTESTLNKGTKQHHKYGEWLRNDLYDEIRKMVLSDNIKNLNVFNEKSLKSLVEIWHKQSTTTVSKLDELISWIASLSVFITEYDIKSSLSDNLTYIDSINSIIGPLNAKLYSQLRRRIRG